MEEEKKAIETNVETIAPQEAANDAEARIEALEADKAAILERESNYKLAYLKEKKKNENPEPLADETDEERIRRITREELANNQIHAIDLEKEALLKKALKENKELKLAIQNKVPDKPTSGGASTEQPVVVSTTVTSEQIAAFKARGWTDKDIERYKKNLAKNTR